MPVELHPVVLHHVVNTLEWKEFRPLQRAALEPVLSGSDCLLVAPTAGGKTEAAVLPLLSRMQNLGWSKISLLYVCPLRALLNNLEPRLDGYARWLGRSARVWHGDTTAAARHRIVAERPDLLLTTPESLEAMLVSARLGPHDLLGTVRVVVVDEIHAFAGDDRGVHLRSLLDRLTRISGNPIQRIGLSATVGNPEELLGWLQGGRPHEPGVVITGAPGPRLSTEPGSVGPVGPVRVVAGSAISTVIPAPSEAEVTVDHVGSLDNAATVLHGLHRGEKKLVFVDSRRDAERLAATINAHHIKAYVSHSSLSAAERARTEKAFAEDTNCVIVATSTLELGIDVGDVDGVVQIGSPATVASFLQRLGRSGCRPGTTRSMLFLCPEDDQVLVALGILQLWRQGYVEPVVPPSVPRHLFAQQLLAVCLQEGRIGRNAWREWLTTFDDETLTDALRIIKHLVEEGHLDQDQGMLFIGPEVEQRYGRYYFRDLVSSFTSAPEFAVLHGRHLLGAVDPILVTRRVTGTRRLLLAGRSWQVRDIDWKRKRLYVEPSDVPGAAQWFSSPRAQSFALTHAMRAVADRSDVSGVQLSQRAVQVVRHLRSSHAPHVDPAATVLVARDSRWYTWWTWAGGRGNLTMSTALDAIEPGLVAEEGRGGDFTLRISADAGVGRLRVALRALTDEGIDGARIAVDERAIRNLKFGELLPGDLAADTLARRLTDTEAAKFVASQRLIDGTGL